MSSDPERPMMSFKKRKHFAVTPPESKRTTTKLAMRFGFGHLRCEVLAAKDYFLDQII